MTSRGFDKIDFLTSDSHFGHANVIVFDKRPFKTIDEMDEALIDNWNAKVKNRNADVFHLGDFAFRNKKPISWYTERLYGRIHLIFGNHDDKGARKERHLFASTHEALYMRQGGHKISLYHYACRTWRSAHHGGWALHGHSHGRLKGIGKSMDVGIMNHNYAPLSFAEVEAHMAAQSIYCPDHGVDASEEEM